MTRENVNFFKFLASLFSDIEMLVVILIIFIALFVSFLAVDRYYKNEWTVKQSLKTAGLMSLTGILLFVIIGGTFRQYAIPHYHIDQDVTIRDISHDSESIKDDTKQLIYFNIDGELHQALVSNKIELREGDTIHIKSKPLGVIMNNHLIKDTSNFKDEGFTIQKRY